MTTVSPDTCRQLGPAGPSPNLTWSYRLDAGTARPPHRSQSSATNHLASSYLHATVCSTRRTIRVRRYSSNVWRYITYVVTDCICVFCVEIVVSHRKFVPATSEHSAYVRNLHPRQIYLLSSPNYCKYKIHREYALDFKTMQRHASEYRTMFRRARLSFHCSLVVIICVTGVCILCQSNSIQ